MITQADDTAGSVPGGSSWGELRVHWPTLLIAMLGMALSVSALPFYTAGVFLGPLHDAFGWTRGQISSAHTVLFFGIAASSPLAGAIIDRMGVRTVVLGSMLMMTASFVALSFLGGSWPAYLMISGAIGFFGGGASAVAFTRVVTGKFQRARGIALGICLMGSGLTGVLAPPLVQDIIANWGWRYGYRALALITLVGLPLMLFLDTSTHKSTAADSVPRKAQGFPYVRNYRFWLLVAAVCLMTFGSTGASYHLTPLLTELTRSARTAARQASILGIAVILARVVSGWAMDRLFAPFVALIVAAMSAVACVAFAQSLASWTIPAILLLGASLGADFDLFSYLTSRYFPAAAYGRVYGVIIGISFAVAGLSPFLVGVLYDRMGNYQLGYRLAAGAFIAAMPFLLALGPYPSAERRRKVAQALA